MLAFHERLLAEHGGSAGIRDKGLLDSAHGRPQNLFAYGKPSLFGLAASYGFGMLKNPRSLTAINELVLRRRAFSLTSMASVSPRRKWMPFCAHWLSLPVKCQKPPMRSG